MNKELRLWCVVKETKYIAFNITHKHLAYWAGDHWVSYEGSKGCIRMKKSEAKEIVEDYQTDKNDKAVYSYRRI